jgi:uncharacterized repeat protein (TIGR01451 family)
VLVCESLERRALLTTYTVSNPSDSATMPAVGSLRYVINEIEGDTQTQDTIDFAIGSAGSFQSIALVAPLPAITKSVLIDGSSQGSSATPLIQIQPAQGTTASNGLVFTGGSSTVEGLAIVGFSGAAIVLNAPSNANVIESDYLGLVGAGPSVGGNQDGIWIDGSSYNTIGGGAAALANVISGNLESGVLIGVGLGAATDNEIVGNDIGTTPSGLSALGNGQNGISIEGATGTLIGYPGPGFGNVISGNLGPGIVLSASATGTFIENNLIGVGADGQTLVGNASDGIQLDDAPGNQIGGTQLGAGNVIGGNKGNGISTSGDSTGTVVEGNFIGTDPTGSLRLSNDENGIDLASSTNTIGGTVVGASNLIDYNGSGQAGSGVELDGDVVQDEILSNSIYGDAGLGINLGDGPTPNHQPGTPGPNDYQNYPDLSLAQSDGTSTTVNGSLYSTPNTQFLLQIFASPSPSSSDFGEGKVLIGSQLVTTDNNGDASFVLNFSVGVAVGQYISATATSPTGDTSEFSQDVQVQGQINLTLSAVGTPNPVLAGQLLTYTLTVTNQGTTGANDVQLTDQPPSSVTVQSATPSQGYIEPMTGTSNVVAMLGTLGPGGSVTVTIVVRTGTSFIGTITDQATVTCQQADPDPAAETASVSTTVATSADLGVSLTSTQDSVLAGQNLTYSVLVTNAGPDVADGVTVTLPLATGVSYISSTAQSVTSSDGQVVVSLGTLAVNASDTFSLTVSPSVAGELAETATVAGTVIDPNPANNSSTCTTTVNPAADLAVGIAASGPAAVTGSDFQYTVSVTNIGPSDATSVQLSDTLPSGVSFESATPYQSIQPVEINGVVSLAIPELDAGAAASFTIDVTVTAEPGSSLTDSASVSSAVTDPVPANNTQSLETPVVGTSDLSLTANPVTGPNYVGQDLTFTLTAQNGGPDDEPDAVVTATLPSDVQFVSAGSSLSSDGPAATVTHGVLTIAIGALDFGQSATVTAVVIPEAAAAGTLSIPFAIQGQNMDPDPGNNTATASATVTPASDMAIAITPGTDSPCVQEDWSYTLKVSNLGLSNATGVTALAPLPPNTQFVSAQSTLGPAPTLQAGVVTDDLGAMNSGQSATVTIVVEPTVTGSMSLTASVSADQYDPHQANNQVSAAITVDPSVNLSVALASSSASVLTGRNLTFTATVTNSGPDPATNVVLDVPPASGFAYVSSSTTLGSLGWSNGELVAQLGELDPGSTAQISMVMTATTAEQVNQTATVTAVQNQLNPAQLTATIPVTVQESAGILQFSSSQYAVPDTAGGAVLTVSRTDGSMGPVTINYQTVAVNATPGVDFVPTAGTLSFGSGQTAATIQVPVLNDPWENHDEYVNVVLQSPGGGALLGSPATASLRIIDVDPDVTPPEVSVLSMSGSGKSITSVSLSFDAPLNPTYAANPANYQLVGMSKGQVVGIGAINYNPATFTVTIVPAAPLAPNQYYRIQVVGSGPTAVRDIAGNLLDGAGNGSAGSNYVASFAEGNKLQYTDSSGNKVTLKLAGPGYLEQIRDASGDGELLELVGEVPHRTTLSGTIHRVKGSSGRTMLGTVTGLGNFGDVKVLLTSPPFLVTQYPFQRKGRGVL